MPVHGIDDGNNKHAVYTAEEVLAILQQAIDSGSLQGIDPEKNPIVAAIRESHNNSNLTFWSGTEDEFNALTDITTELVGARIGSDGKLYVLTGDTTLSDTVEAARQAALEATEGMKREVISVTLLANAWSNEAPYTQTVAVAGMTADKDFLAPYVVPTGNESDDLAAQVALSCISGGTTDTDSVTFYCYDEKPTTTITVFMVDKGTKIESGDFPIASKSAPGIMQVGDGLEVDANGKVSVEDTTGEEKHKIIFMPVSNAISADTAAGDCSVIKTKTGKTVMIDTGATHSYGLIKTELQNNNIEKIDYLIITHFHSDHTGNIESLARDFDLSETVFYLQKHSDAATGVTEGAEESVLAVAGENSVIRPNSGETLTVDGITITFFNCDQEDVDYYDTQNTSVNNYSVCCYVDCGENAFLFTGDIMSLAAQRVYNQGWLRKVDVEKVEHHSVIYGADGMSDFNLSIRPEYAIVSASAGMLPLLAFNSSETNAVKIAQGTTVLGTIGSAVRILFNEETYSITDGRRVYANINRATSRVNLYVDSTYTGVSDGTSAKPFKNLLAALGMARSFRGIEVRINIQSSYTSEEEIRLFYCPTRITVVGNITIKNLTIIDSDIYFNGVVTVTDTIDSCVAIEESNARFDELVIAGDTTEATNDGRGLRTAMSSIRITTLNISNRKTAFGIYRASRVQIDEIKGTANTYGYIVTEGSTLAVSKWNADFATTREYKARYYATASKSPFIHFSPDAIEKITSGADLDDYNVPGIYMSQTGAITTSLTNKPSGIGYAFSLKVEYLNGVNNLLQTITSGNLDHTNTGIYVRVFDQSQQVWSKWQTVINGEA